jgi:hypothetical protein
MVWFWEGRRPCRVRQNFLRNLIWHCNERQNSKNGSSTNNRSFMGRINVSLFTWKSWRTYGISKEMRSEIIRSNDASDGLHRKLGLGLCKFSDPRSENGYINVIFFMSVHKYTTRCSLNWTLYLVTHFVDLVVEMYQSYFLKKALWGLKHAVMT